MSTARITSLRSPTEMWILSAGVVSKVKTDVKPLSKSFTIRLRKQIQFPPFEYLPLRPFSTCSSSLLNPDTFVKFRLQFWYEGISPLCVPSVRSIFEWFLMQSGKLLFSFFQFFRRFENTFRIVRRNSFPF